MTTQKAPALPALPPVPTEVVRAFHEFKQQLWRSAKNQRSETDHVGQAEEVLFERIRAALAAKEPTSEPSAERQALDEAFTAACKQWKNVVTTGEVSKESAPFYFTLFKAGYEAGQARAGAERSQPVAWAIYDDRGIQQAALYSDKQAAESSMSRWSNMTAHGPHVMDPLYTHSRAEAPVGPAFVHLLAEFERIRNRHWMHWDSIDQSASGQAILEARAELTAAQEKSVQSAEAPQCWLNGGPCVPGRCEKPRFCAKNDTVARSGPAEALGS